MPRRPREEQEQERQRRIAALPPAVRALIEQRRGTYLGLELGIIEAICELLQPPAELYTPDGAVAHVSGVEVSADVLSRAIAAGKLPAVPVYGAGGTRVCHGITAAAARSIRRQRARAGEPRCKAPAPKKRKATA